MIKKNQKTIWNFPIKEIPKRIGRSTRKVEVITYLGEQVIGSFEADNNWCIPGYPYDLFNNDIIVWRYEKDHSL